MWLSKPVYEILPYFYFVAGLLALGASAYVNYWYWPTIGTIVGFACLVAGLVVWLKRKDYRHSRDHYRIDTDSLDDL